MNLAIRTVDHVTILELAGRLDAGSTPPVAEALRKLTAAAPAHVVVNLSGVNFMDSTALAALVQGLKRARQVDGNVRLCNIQQPVRIIFELTRLEKAFDIYASELDAVKAFGA